MPVEAAKIGAAYKIHPGRGLLKAGACTFVIVRKGCAYIILFAILVQVSPVLQLLKMPVLLEHFSEHQQRSPGIAFMDFLAMHYWGQDAQDDDTDRDMELPFKKSPAQEFQIQGAYVSNPVFGLKPHMIWGSTPDYPLSPQSMLPETFKGALFKPPKA